MPIVKYVKENLLDAKEPFICHGVNCLGVMGAGVAKQIAEKWPESYKEYKQYCSIFAKEPSQLLGRSVGTYEKNADKFIIHMFTQVKISYQDRQANYGAIARCFCKLNDSIIEDWQQSVLKAYEDNHLSMENDNLTDEQKALLPPKPSVAIPKIGSGLGGGAWSIIEEIINTCTPDVDVIVYELG